MDNNHGMLPGPIPRLSLLLEWDKKGCSNSSQEQIIASTAWSMGYLQRGNAKKYSEILGGLSMHSVNQTFFARTAFSLPKAWEQQLMIQ